MNSSHIPSNKATNESSSEKQGIILISLLIGGIQIIQ